MTTSNANLLALSQEALGQDAPRLLGSFLRESEDAIRTAVDSLLPVVIGTLAREGGTLEGASGLLSLASVVRLDVSLPEGMEALLIGPMRGVNDLLKAGTGRLVPRLYGNKCAALVNAIASTSGIRRLSATTLVALIVPIVLTVAKRHAGDNGIAANAMSSLFRSQWANVRYKLDSRITGALGFARPTDFVDEPLSPLGADVAVSDAAVRSRATLLPGPDVAAAAATGTRGGMARWLSWRSFRSERRV